MKILESRAPATVESKRKEEKVHPTETNAYALKVEHTTNENAKEA